MKRILAFVIFFIFSHINHAATKDLWQQLASSFKLKDQSNQLEVKQQIRWLLLHPDYFQALAKNSKPYIYFILEEIKKQSLPGELALLPMIESNYNPFAYSHVGAAGLWQLMPGTGSGLGIKQNWWYDGRRGITSSTFAALDYMKYLGRFFKGNWTHAIAAYDSGEGTVQRAINKNNINHLPTDFWSLKLPRETQAYLPRLLAMVSIIKYPNYFGIKLPAQNYEPYFEEVPLTSQIDLSHAAKLANISYETLLKLNPGHNRWTTAPSHNHLSLLLPRENVAIFLKNLEKTPKAELTSWERYQVQKGDNLSLIAQKKQASVALIQTINKLESSTIKLGQQLLIPLSKTLPTNSFSEVQRRLAINHAKIIGPHQVIHVIQAGDSLDKLSKQYFVRQSEIIFWNQLKSSQLDPGKKLLIWQKRSPTDKLYQVKSGDSLSSIAHKHQLSVKQLKMLNPQLNNKLLIKPKQKLRLK